MREKRKIQLIGRKLSFADAEDEDIFFWADKTWAERIAETERLRRLIWTHRLGYYPLALKRLEEKF